MARDFTTAPVEPVQPDEELETAVEALLGRRVSALPVVVAAGRLGGMLSVQDVLRAYLRAIEEAEAPGELGASTAERTSADPLTVAPETPVAEALDAAGRSGVRHLPVLSDGWFVGLVTATCGWPRGAARTSGRSAGSCRPT